MVASIGKIASPAQGVSYFEEDGHYPRDDAAHREASTRSEERHHPLCVPQLDTGRARNLGNSGDIFEWACPIFRDHLTGKRIDLCGSAPYHGAAWQLPARETTTGNMEWQS